jgi:hypothetical protein
LHGTWKGDRDWRKINTTNEAAARALSAIDLILKPDGSFTLTDGGMPFTGSWVQSGNMLDLRVETFMNTTLDRQTKAVQDASQFVVEYQNGDLHFRAKTEEGSTVLKRSESKKTS